MARPEAVGQRARGQRRRQSLVEAAAAIVLAEGPGAVTHRAVAERASCPLSATTYYFSGLDDLLGAAGAYLVGRWAEQAEGVRDEVAREGAGAPSDRRELRDGAPKPGDVVRRDVVTAVIDALLPAPGEVRGHYAQLVGAGANPAVARAYRSGRARLDAAVGEILTICGSTCLPALAVAVVDGAVVSALSEGRDVRLTAAALLRHVV
jgi:AcrR family transcriptional regulator